MTITNITMPSLCRRRYVILHYLGPTTQQSALFIPIQKKKQSTLLHNKKRWYRLLHYALCTKKPAFVATTDIMLANRDYDAAHHNNAILPLFSAERRRRGMIV